MSIYERLAEKSVLFISSADRENALKALIKGARANGFVADTEEFERAILEREALVSTGIGLGVAVPHAKLPSIREFFIVIGLAKEPIEWDSLDGQGVRIVFLIGGPDSRQKEYLSILAKLMLVIKNPAIREAILSASTPAEVLKPFLNA